ncbi:MAG: GldG family protein [Tannerellaceae bacterium]|nr:GldG family protein [Tannerellaceae bacterium]
MRKILSITLLALLTHTIYAQKKTILLDVSHEIDTAYTYVNPKMFEQYEDMVENKIGANIIVNKDNVLDESLLAEIDVLIILSPLKKDRDIPKNNLTHIEREAIVNYIRNGGKAIVFMDEENRVDMESFGGNDIVKPFGMEYGPDLPMKPNIGATSLVTEAIEKEYELSTAVAVP